MSEIVVARLDELGPGQYVASFAEPEIEPEVLLELIDTGAGEPGVTAPGHPPVSGQQIPRRECVQFLGVVTPVPEPAAFRGWFAWQTIRRFLSL